MITGENYIKIVKQFYSFLEIEFDFQKVNETINGSAFYDVELKDKEKVISISYENIENHLDIIVFILKNEKLPDYDGKTRTLHLNQLIVQVLPEVDKSEIYLNNEFFANFKVRDILERKLLKGAKELRLCLNHFDKIMGNVSNYLNFVREKGRPLSEINQGSVEIALTVNDALYALNLLNKSQTAILGGDILSEKENGELVYAYQFWGDGQEYHYLNWCCDKMDHESQEDYVTRSYIIAKESIITANDIAKHLGKKCYIVIVI